MPWRKRKKRLLVSRRCCCVLEAAHFTCLVSAIRVGGKQRCSKGKGETEPVAGTPASGRRVFFFCSHSSRPKRCGEHLSWGFPVHAGRLKIENKKRQHSHAASSFHLGIINGYFT